MAERAALKRRRLADPTLNSIRNRRRSEGLRGSAIEGVKRGFRYPRVKFDESLLNILLRDWRRLIFQLSEVLTSRHSR